MSLHRTAHTLLKVLLMNRHLLIRLGFTECIERMTQRNLQETISTFRAAQKSHIVTYIVNFYQNGSR